MTVKYPVGATDADGNVFIEDYGVRYITRYIPSDDDWGTTRVSGDGFYGADKSGTLYYDGNQCGYGDFGTLAGGFRFTSWSVTNNPPLDEKHASSAMSISLSADDVVHMQTISPISNDKVYASSALRWYVTGDFDVEVEWLEYSSSYDSGTAGGAIFVCKVDDKHLSYIRRSNLAGTEGIRSAVRLDGSELDFATVLTSVTAGKFRYTRTSGVIRRYYDIGGGWIQTGTDQTIGDEAVYFWVGMGTEGAATSMNVKFTNLLINSGTIDTTIGWYRESFGSHRGNKKDFPDNVIVVSTDSSIDMIDVDTDLLWMRFLLGANNVLDSSLSIGTWRPYRLTMKNGVLLIGMTSSADEGYLVRIDFNLDCVNIHRKEGSSLTGANYKSSHGDGNLGVFYAQGAMRGRNDGEDWSGDYDDWKQQEYPARHGDIYVDGGYEYRASANAGGLAVFKWHRWYLCDVTPPDGIGAINWTWDTSGNLMYWCFFRTNGELMYTDNINLYSVEKATYEASYGGTFSADNVKALPGTRSNDVQKMLVSNGNRFYLPADEGIYQVDWPSGSFIHQFGSSGSGAVHEILPDDVTVQDLSFVVDGGMDILVVVLYFTVLDVNQVIYVNLTNNLVWGYSSQTSINMEYAESVT